MGRQNERVARKTRILLTDVFDAVVKGIVHPLGDGYLLTNAMLHLKPLVPCSLKGRFVHKAIQLVGAFHLIHTSEG